MSEPTYEPVTEEYLSPADSGFQWPQQAREDLLGLAEMTEENILAVLAPHVQVALDRANDVSYTRGYEAGRVSELSEPFEEPQMQAVVVSNEETEEEEDEVQWEIVNEEEEQ